MAVLPLPHAAHRFRRSSGSPWRPIRKFKPRSRASVGWHASPSAAAMAPSSMSLRIAALPDRARAAQPAPLTHWVQPKPEYAGPELRKPSSRSFRVTGASARHSGPSRQQHRIFAPVSAATRMLAGTGARPVMFRIGSFSVLKSPMSEAAVHRQPPRFNASVVPGARPAPSPSFIEPCRPALLEEAPSGGRWIHEIKFAATAPADALPFTPEQALTGRGASSTRATSGERPDRVPAARGRPVRRSRRRTARAPK